MFKIRGTYQLSELLPPGLLRELQESHEPVWVFDSREGVAELRLYKEWHESYLTTGGLTVIPAVGGALVIIRYCERTWFTATAERFASALPGVLQRIKMPGFAAAELWQIRS